jgi:hypothetical protein
VKLIPRWRDEIYACPSAFEVKRPIEVRGPMLGVVNQDRSLHIRPLGNEVGKRLRLDCVARPEVDGIGAELDRPFNDAAAGFLVAKDVTEWVLSDYRYVVGVKVVTELPGCDQNSVQQLLDLGVASLRLV